MILILAPTGAAGAITWVVAQDILVAQFCADFCGNVRQLVQSPGCWRNPVGTVQTNCSGAANVEQGQIVGDLSITRGNHDFKLGVNFRRDDVSDFTAGELQRASRRQRKTNDAIDGRKSCRRKVDRNLRGNVRWSGDQRVESVPTLYRYSEGRCARRGSLSTSRITATSIASPAPCTSVELHGETAILTPPGNGAL